MSANERAVDASDSYTVLNVCLCDGPTAQAGQFAVCVCHDHQTVPLQTLIDRDVKCLLHGKNAAGDIVPLHVPCDGRIP